MPSTYSFYEPNTTSGPSLLPKPLEQPSKVEESPSDYQSGGYLQISVGDKFKSGRYRVLRKLGWGHFSTVWLVKDNLENRHSALKVVKSASRYTETARDEIKLCNRVDRGSGKPHPGREHIVSFLDSFTHEMPDAFIRSCNQPVASSSKAPPIPSPQLTHVCMVFEPLGENLLSLIERHKKRGVPPTVVKLIAKQALLGLAYLHDECDLIHTDLKPENFLICIPDIENHIDASLSVAPHPTSRRVGVPLPSKSSRNGVAIPRSGRNVARQVMIFDSQPLVSPARSFGGRHGKNKATPTTPCNKLTVTSTSSSSSTESLFTLSNTASVVSTPPTSLGHSFLHQLGEKSMLSAQIAAQPSLFASLTVEDRYGTGVSPKSKGSPLSREFSMKEDKEVRKVPSVQKGKQKQATITVTVMETKFEEALSSSFKEQNRFKELLSKTKPRMTHKASSSSASSQTRLGLGLSTTTSTLAPALVTSASAVGSSASLSVEAASSSVEIPATLPLAQPTPSLLTQTAPRPESTPSASLTPTPHIVPSAPTTLAPPLDTAKSIPVPVSKAVDVPQTPRSSPAAFSPAARSLMQNALLPSAPTPTPLSIKIADLGNATPSKKHYTEDIQTRQYRAPEAIVGRKDWDSKVDIWSMACVIFELLTAEYLFDPQGQGELFTKDDDHMAQIIELLGDFAFDAKMGGKYSRELFDSTGTLRYIHNLKPWPLRRVMCEKYNYTDAQSRDLCAFLEPMLCPDMRGRSSAQDMLSSKWLEVSDEDLENLGDW